MKRLIFLFGFFLIVTMNLSQACTGDKSDCKLPPVASFSYYADPSNPKKVIFDASLSFNPNPGSKLSLKYSWDFKNGSGELCNTKDPVHPTCTYKNNGLKEVILTVSFVEDSTLSAKSVQKIEIGKVARTIEFSDFDVTVTEGQSAIESTLQLSAPAEEDLYINLQPVYLNGASVLDLNPPLVAVISKGQTSAVLSFLAVDDQLSESPEQVNLTISSVSSNNVILGDNVTLAISIIDNDSGTPPCNGATGTPHPNGGGFVSSDSMVDSSVLIPAGMEVCGGSVIEDGIFSDKTVVINTRINGPNLVFAGAVEIIDSRISRNVLNVDAGDGQIRITNTEIVNLVFDNPNTMNILGSVQINNSYLYGNLYIDGKGIFIDSLYAGERAKILDYANVVNVQMSDDSVISGHASASNILFMVDNASITDFAKVNGGSGLNSQMYKNSKISGFATVNSSAFLMSQNARISGNAKVSLFAFSMYEDALITDNVIAESSNPAALIMSGHSQLRNEVKVKGDLFIGENAMLLDNVEARGGNVIYGNVIASGKAKVQDVHLCNQERITENTYGVNNCSRPLPPLPLPSLFPDRNL